MDKENFVTYDQAKKLKEIGFREPCLYFYTEDQILVDNCYSGGDEVYVEDLKISHNEFKTPEEALSAGITKYLEIEKSGIAFFKIYKLIEAKYGGNVEEISYHTAGIAPNLEVIIEEEFDEDFRLLRPLIFKNTELAKQFLEENIQIVKEYYML